MKWTRKPVKDGAYLTYKNDGDQMGLLIMRDGRWFGRSPHGLIEVFPTGIDYFCRIVKPK